MVQNPCTDKIVKTMPVQPEPDGEVNEMKLVGLLSDNDATSGFDVVMDGCGRMLLRDRGEILATYSLLDYTWQGLRKEIQRACDGHPGGCDRQLEPGYPRIDVPGRSWLVSPPEQRFGHWLCPGADTLDGGESDDD